MAVFAQLTCNVFKWVGLKFLANTKFPRNTVLLHSGTVSNVGQSQRGCLAGENRDRGRKIWAREILSAQLAELAHLPSELLLESCGDSSLHHQFLSSTWKITTCWGLGSFPASLRVLRSCSMQLRKCDFPGKSVQPPVQKLT